MPRDAVLTFCPSPGGALPYQRANAPLTSSRQLPACRRRQPPAAVAPPPPPPPPRREAPPAPLVATAAAAATTVPVPSPPSPLPSASPPLTITRPTCGEDLAEAATLIADAFYPPPPSPPPPPSGGARRLGWALATEPAAAANAWLRRLTAAATAAATMAQLVQRHGGPLGLRAPPGGAAVVGVAVPRQASADDDADVLLLARRGGELVGVAEVFWTPLPRLVLRSRPVVGNGGDGGGGAVSSQLSHAGATVRRQVAAAWAAFGAPRKRRRLLANVAVSAKCRREGIATALIEAALGAVEAPASGADCATTAASAATHTRTVTAGPAHGSITGRAASRGGPMCRHKLYLIVEASNDPAVRVYRRAGGVPLVTEAGAAGRWLMRLGVEGHRQGRDGDGDGRGKGGGGGGPRHGSLAPEGLIESIEAASIGLVRFLFTPWERQ